MSLWTFFCRDSVCHFTNWGNNEKGKEGGVPEVDPIGKCWRESILRPRTEVRGGRRVDGVGFFTGMYEG